MNRKIDWTDYRREFQVDGTVNGAINRLVAKGWTLDEAKESKAEYDYRVKVSKVEAAQERARTAAACGYALPAEDAALCREGGKMITDDIRSSAKAQ